MLEHRALEVLLALHLHPVAAAAVDPQVAPRHPPCRQQGALDRGNPVVASPADDRRLLDLVDLRPKRHIACQRWVVERRIRVLQVLHRTRRSGRGEARLDELLCEHPLVGHHRLEPGDDPLPRRVGVEVHEPQDPLRRRRTQDRYAGTTRSVQQESRHSCGVVQGDGHRHVAAHRVADQADLLEPQRVKQSDDRSRGDVEVVALVDLRATARAEPGLVDDDRADPLQLREVGAEVGPAGDPRTAAVQKHHRVA